MNAKNRKKSWQPSLGANSTDSNTSTSNAAFNNSSSSSANVGASSASRGTASKTSITSIVRVRTIDKVGVGRRAPWWPLLLFPLIPAIVAAVGFSKNARIRLPDNATVVGVVETTLDPVAAAKTTPITVAALVTDTKLLSVSTAAPTTVAVAPLETTPAALTTVIGVAALTPRLTKLSAALTASGLATSLQGAGPFTVFAPSDEALSILPPGTIEGLLQPENQAALAKVLGYHVVPKRLEVSDLAQGTYTTLDGATITLAGTEPAITVSDSDGPSAVSTPGLPADNGVVYIIDRLLTPPGFNMPGQTNQAGDAIVENLTVYFESGSSGLNSEANAKVSRAVDILQRVPAGTNVILVGHADIQGSAESNLTLSKARVDTVLEALKAQLGEGANNLTFSSDHKGEEQPESGSLAKSRRVTIEVPQ